MIAGAATDEAISVDKEPQRQLGGAADANSR
jgi:hypothetical protein